MSIYISDQKVEFLLQTYPWFQEFINKSTTKLSKKDLSIFKDNFDSFKAELDLENSDFESIRENPQQFHALIKFRKRRMQIFAEQYAYSSKKTVKCFAGKKYYATNWIHSKKIKIFNVSLLSNDISQKVKEGLQDLISTIHLDFDVVVAKMGDGLFRAVQSAVHSSSISKGIDISKVEKKLIPFREHNNCAFVIITDKGLVHENISQGDVGYGNFKSGFIFFGFKNGNINSDFVKRLAKHECGHLLGLETHHEILKDADYLRFLYTRTGKGDCNMCPSATNLNTCKPCIESIIYFWKGIEHHTKTKFLK